MITPKNTYITCKVAFGSSRTGKTVQYQILSHDGSVLEAYTATGVVELGYGEYGVRRQFTSLFQGYIRWKEVEDSLYASSSITIVDDYLTNISNIFKIETGRWRIDTATNTMIFYDSNGTDVLYTFNLKTDTGSPTSTAPFERVPV